MPRPRKVGLDYFPVDVDRRNDFKIMDLLNEFGPLGYVVYDLLLQYIYANGYYLDVPLSQVVLLLTKDIGAKWVKNKDLVLQVIYYCADIGLFDHALLQQNIITSVGIQRRYNEVTVRNKVDKTKYWLLDTKPQKNETACVSATKTLENVTETPVSATKTLENVTETPQKKSKEKESKEKKNNNKGQSANRGLNLSDVVPSEILPTFKEFVKMRTKIKKPLTDYAIKRAVSKLETLAPNDYDQQNEILNQSIDGCWQGLYPLREEGVNGNNGNNGRSSQQATRNTSGGAKTGTYY